MNSSSAIEQLRELSHTGSAWDPLIDVFFFLASSMVIIWRLEAISARGVEGTILGTLFMPYFSGLGNLLFVYVILRNGGPGGEVLINCVVNNATNITLIVGLCGIIWPLALGTRKTSKATSKTKAPVKLASGGGKADTQVRLHRLSLVFTMLAMLFFTGISWALGRDGNYDMGDGWTLIGLFLFWQAFHVFEVLKDNVRQGSSWSPLIIFDLGMIAGASLVLYFSVEWLVEWIMSVQSGFFSSQQLGLLTGWLMVLP
ncbi:MAG: sodium:calcium symporter, partial [Opitutales bacterium]